MSTPVTGPLDVAITGASVLNTLADSLDGFAEALFAGRSGVRATDAPGEQEALPAALLSFDLADWIARNLPSGAASSDVLAGLGRRVAPPAGTAACVAEDALRAAEVADQDRAQCALIVAGNNLALDYQARTTLGFAERPGSLRPSHAVTHLDFDAVGTVSAVTGVRAEGCTVGAASASSAVAVMHAARLVCTGWVPRCLVVAPLAELAGAELRALRLAGALAGLDDGDDPAAVCRPFDRGRRGFVYGQGAAAIVLQRGADSRREGARVLAYLDGFGQRLDGRRGTEPDRAGQVAAMIAAIRSAGLTAADIDYVNAHATGSMLGDEVEAAALLELFGADGPPVNSTKPMVGHCLSGAGLQELIATALQLRAGTCHPNPNLDRPLERAPNLVGGQPLPGEFGVALTNNLAFDGLNASIVLTHPDRTERS